MFHSSSGLGYEACEWLLCLLPCLIHLALTPMQARDLAALAGSCTQLRHLASVDSLWEVLYKQEFTHATHAGNTLVKRG